MENFKVKDLKALAKERGIKGYYRLRKAELIEVLTPVGDPHIPQNIIDQPIPEIDIPILEPSKPANTSKVSQLKNLASNAAKPVKREINKFADWIISKVPEPIKKTVNERVDSLKERVNRIFKRYDNLTPKEHKTAIKGYFKTFRVNGVDGMDEKTFINIVKPRVINLIKSKGSIKVKLILTVRFTKENPATGNIDINIGYFATDPVIITESTDLSDLYNTMTSRIFELIQNFQNRGSGWQFDRIEHLDININPFNPLSASSYIELPKKLAEKKAIINVKNENDNECFKWAVTSAVFPAKEHGERLSKQMREDSKKFDWAGIEFPVSLKQIDKFEKQNNYAINVFGYEKVVYPLRISKRDEHSCEQVINLLLITNEETNHYCWIKNMSKLLSKQKSNHNGKIYFCYRCLNSFYSVKSLGKHTEYCQNNEAVKIEMSGGRLYFKNHYKKQRVPFVVYADFECFTQKIDTCQPDDGKSFTNQYQKHKPSGFCYLIKCFDDNLFYPKLVKYTAESTDEDIPQLFVESLEKDIKEIYNKFKKPKEMVMTQEDKIDFRRATHCHICEEELKDTDDENYRIVRDHCHLTGKYRGAAHNMCNLKFRLPGKEVSLSKVHGKRYEIPLDHPVICDNGSLYPKALTHDLTFVITLPDVDELVNHDKAEEKKTPPNYKLENIELEYHCIKSDQLAREAMATYQTGKGFYYENVHYLKNFTISKPNDSIINEKVDTSRRSMTGILLLFEESYDTGKRDSEKFLNPDIRSVNININGMPNQLYSKGMIHSDFWEAIKRRMGRSGSLKEKDFYTGDKFGLWIDLRTFFDNSIHGGGLRNTKDGVKLEIKRNVSGSGIITCHMFLVADAVMEIINKDLKSIMY